MHTATRTGSQEKPPNVNRKRRKPALDISSRASQRVYDNRALPLFAFIFPNPAPPPTAKLASSPSTKSSWKMIGDLPLPPQQNIDTKPKPHPRSPSPLLTNHHKTINKNVSIASAMQKNRPINSKAHLEKIKM
ncbi:hypothetical protein BDZ45DRAFT_749441 [Acephala macrosclerotiorum]|nr:hypothetical protein BDZ45DRAFT_749441 [Acephala macrosclerotiorum]